MPDDDSMAQRRRVETALRNSEEQLASLLSSMDDAVWSITPDTWEVLYLNPAVERIYARPADDFRKDPKLWEKMLHAEDRERVVLSNQRLAQTGSVDNEYRIVRDDGTVRWVRSRGHAIRDAAGVIVRFDGIMADITERREAREALRESERRLKEMLDNVALLSLMTGPDGRITYCNDYLLRLTGWQREEMLGRALGELVASNTGALPTVAPGPFTDHPEVRHQRTEILTRSGRHRVIDWNNSPLRSPEGKLIGMAAIGVDVTDRVKAESELRRSLAELEEVATAASHDLREPLRAVAGYSELLVRRLGASAAGAEEFVRFMAQGIEHMSEVIDGLLRFVTVSRDRMDLTPCNLNTLFRHTCLQIDASVRRCDATVRSGSLPTLPVDGRRIAEVFRELLDNALKFRGTDPPTVCLDAQAGVREWTFALRDNGIGVEPAHATRVFELYRRLNPSEQYRGRGVGLAICRKIIERHGGYIWLEPGNPGTIVRFTLPVAQLSGA